MIVSEHRVDGLAELGTACLIDTAGVDPNIPKLSLRDPACFFDLVITTFVLYCFEVLHLLERHLFSRLPGVRENGKRIHRLVGHLLQLQGLGINKPHLEIRSEHAGRRNGTLSDFGKAKMPFSEPMQVKQTGTREPDIIAHRTY